MNFGRDFLIPPDGNTDSWTPVTPGKPIPEENGSGQNRGSWTTAMLGVSISQGNGTVDRGDFSASKGNGSVGSGDFWTATAPRRQILADDGIVCGNKMTPGSPIPMGNGNSWGIPQGNGIVQNSDNWNHVMSENAFPPENGIGEGMNSLTPLTPAKPVSQRSNMVPVETQRNQSENENWQDLIGIYKDLLQEDTFDLNLVQDLTSKPLQPAPAPAVQNNGNENGVASTTKRDSKQTPKPSPNPNHSSDHALTSLSFFPTQDPANWKGNLLETIVGLTKGSVCVSSTNGDVLNRASNSNTLTQVRSNSIGSTLAGHTQTFTSNQLINNDFPDPYPYCYNLNSPPRSEPDAAASSSIIGSFPVDPITPGYQGRHMNHQWEPEKVNFSVEEISTLVQNQMVSIRSEAADNDCNVLLQTIGDSSSSVISTMQKEHIVSVEGNGQGIDLNETPPQKTPARRKKHRPKVIREGKPKRTPNPKEPKKDTSNETRVKRKYVRKKGLKASETPQGNGIDETCPVEVPQRDGKRKYVRKKGVNNLESQQKNSVDEVSATQVETPDKSCKKKLNFDLESVARDESQDIRGGEQGINLNANPGDTELERISSILETSKIEQQNGYIGETRIRESFFKNHVQASDQSISLNELNIPFTPIAKARENALNVIARNITMRNSVPGQDSWMNGNNWVGQHVHGGRVGSISTSTNLESAREPMLQGMVNFNNRRGIKRQSFEQMHPRNVNAMDSFLMYQKLLLGAEPHIDDNELASIFVEGHKKKKPQNEVQAPVATESSCITSLDDLTRREAKQNNGIYRNASALQLLNSTGRVNATCNVMNVGGQNVDNHHLRPTMAATQILQRHQVSSGMQLSTERSKGSTQGHGMSSVTATVSWNTPPATPSKEASRSAVVTYSATLLERKQTGNPNLSNQRLKGVEKMLQQHHNDVLEGHQRSTPAKGRARKQKFEASVDEIIYLLEGLHIYDENENALVPYRGDNAMIPFEPIKKRKPRAKVDLDPETDRLWRLLMGKEGSEGTEKMDKDKEKWWEHERRVFRGRADSFIARMHLVQGDRRFSRWKGSVVDSVIGVFLTQNVTDHLSSSAFMSLAAKFPIKSTITNERCCQDRACVLVEEPIRMEPNQNIGKQPLFNQTSFISSDSSEHMRYHISTKRGAPNKSNLIPKEDVILSQDSFDSSTIQTVDEIRSSSGSNSEADDLTTGFETSKESCPPINLFPAEKPSVFKELFSHDNWNIPLDEQSTNMPHFLKTPECNPQIPRVNGVDNLNISSAFTPTDFNIHHAQESLAFPSHFQMSTKPDLQDMGPLCFGTLGGETISPMPSSNARVTEAYHTSNATYQQNEMPRFQAPSLPQYNFLSSHPTHQENFQPRPGIENRQHLNNNHQQGRDFFMEPIGHADILAKGKYGAQNKGLDMLRGTTINSEDRISVVDKHNCLENTAAEASSKENSASHGPLSGVGKNISKAKKGTAEDEKNVAFDWDSLRKQVLSNGEKRERSKDAMDSIDYEALRCAHVNEISNAIRERGMNNLLADRIKDFLYRLVRDHGSIDLEWLREVPPDKAKDYLLSIRGLGLKSVECVRLLTLHHLAFPVDTNVGRIAVRLGWVPLQPLPESLQLHLLEMYPVLESIQKYLWPRLCTLDQLTLYELHYQMITFGKVFCTKSKPNCNACPMRVECRHFASAYASARLALSGPDEKSIVTSDASIVTAVSPPEVSRPMPLPPAENNYNKDAGNFERECEPIIEEPTSPAPETAELSISDIEDQYCEDSEEIPTIKLNMEEFTTNLQNMMQDSMELQGDMSKALVTLNPEVASIPTPKLKNVSRLRTEHQVYELPDSHPLLERLDKREPDDPSPYLLAIWTPGETANSTQFPERGCPAQESGQLCDKTTCFSCNSIKEANSQVVRGTVLIPCRTAMRGSFPLNGTYFQVNEMFADHASSLNPIDVPRKWVWNLPRRTVYFGTSVSTIFKGLSTEGIQYCFWRGFVCVRGFDRRTRAPRPLMARLHFPASKMVNKTKNEANKSAQSGTTRLR